MLVNLPADIVTLVEAKVASGEYASSEEVIRTAMQPWLEHERERAARLDVIRQKITDGLDSPVVAQGDALRRLEATAETLGLPKPSHAA